MDRTTRAKIELIFNAASVLLLLYLGGQVIAAKWPLWSARNVAPELDTSVEGLGVPDFVGALSTSRDSLRVKREGELTLLYVFTTTCPICTRQRDHVESILSNVRGAKVLAISPEPVELLEGYWDQGITTLSVERSFLDSIRLKGVPTLLLVGVDKTVQRAYLGSVLAWTTEEFLSKVVAGQDE